MESNEEKDLKKLNAELEKVERTNSEKKAVVEKSMSEKKEILAEYKATQKKWVYIFDFLLNHNLCACTYFNVFSCKE